MSSYPAKILLFGEYSVLNGSAALTLPFRKFGARFDFISEKNKSETARASNRVLEEFANYISSQKQVLDAGFNLGLFMNEISEGLFLNSTIPENYGLGSSGALVAATCDRYIPHLSEYDLNPLKLLMAQAESFFHGKSSGIDPLSSYVGTPLLFDKGTVKRLHSNSLLAQLTNWYLVDSDQPGKTGLLVDDFIKSLAQPGKKQDMDRYSELVNAAVNAFLGGDDFLFKERQFELSAFQYREFSHLIPYKIRPLWEEGISTGAYALKLCGSGGGGFVLLYSINEQSRLNSNLSDSLIPLL